ncbi:hypothetical protein DFH08DRAFT_1043476 [Mycena albidolilacea]|uniref:Uncharacterized protein n=1 Tax=Mycena albidolilacea TaxID=1033008 RepID=A0AAD7AGY6_9AGAR|nr:hypothetical protein DFH08DRAFT_1043476 [Mycena albidolilacea]
MPIRTTNTLEGNHTKDKNRTAAGGGSVTGHVIPDGEGDGFGNKLSIQTVAIVKAVKALQRIHKVDQGEPSWPVCHILNNTTLYFQLLHRILAGDDVLHGKDGYSSPSPAVSSGMSFTPPWLSAASWATPRSFKRWATKLGGSCTFTAVHGKEIGWEPELPPEHILGAVDAEVELIVKTCEGGKVV